MYFKNFTVCLEIDGFSHFFWYTYLMMFLISFMLLPASLQIGLHRLIFSSVVQGTSPSQLRLSRLRSTKDSKTSLCNSTRKFAGKNLERKHKQHNRNLPRKEKASAGYQIWQLQQIFIYILPIPGIHIPPWRR